MAFLVGDTSKINEEPMILLRILFHVTLIITLVIACLLLVLLKSNLNGLLTFLMYAIACYAFGSMVGFLFGIPRTEKNRFNPKNENGNQNQKNNYADNTNLEEISDWLTKIIVGISLIKLNTIIGWIDNIAVNFANSFLVKCQDSEIEKYDLYVFGYSVIIFYFLIGAGLTYFWSRTNLHIILNQSKNKRDQLERLYLKTTLQNLANESFNVNFKKVTFEDTASQNFRNTTEIIYNAKPIKVKDDLQKGRWGGKNIVHNKILDCFNNKEFTKSSIGLYSINLVVKSLDSNNPLKGEVAFFIHNTFKNEIIYVTAEDNIAKLQLVVWEAFTVGARLEDNTELELDLNSVPGFPEGFYWK